MLILGGRYITVSGCKFKVARLKYQDLASSLEKAQRMAQEQGLEPESTHANLLNWSLQMSARILEWDGIVDSDGNPIECTPENKMWLFSEYPELLAQISREVESQEQADSGN